MASVRQKNDVLFVGLRLLKKRAPYLLVLYYDIIRNRLLREYLCTHQNRYLLFTRCRATACKETLSIFTLRVYVNFCDYTLTADDKYLYTIVYHRRLQ